MYVVDKRDIYMGVYNGKPIGSICSHTDRTEYSTLTTCEMKALN